MSLMVAAFASALLFGIGLGVSGMTLPSKVLGFLDVTGDWDPSLLAVMMGAILVHSISYRLIAKRESPVLVSKFQIPTRRDIDWKLVLGSAIFGAGWGLAGLCPGPALVGVVTAEAPVVIFVASMVAGIYLHNIFNSKFLQRWGK
jgi:uncharacterized membrane protein YedE/YeeE